MGFELFGSIIGAGLIGWLIDKGLGTAPRGLMIGLVVGIIGGGWNFYRRAMIMNRRAMDAYRRRRREREARGEPDPGAKPNRTTEDWFERKQHDSEDEADDDDQFKLPDDIDKY
jgi:hypothetical protein